MKKHARERDRHSSHKCRRFLKRNVKKKYNFKYPLPILSKFQVKINNNNKKKVVFIYRNDVIGRLYRPTLSPFFEKKKKKTRKKKNLLLNNGGRRLSHGRHRRLTPTEPCDVLRLPPHILFFLNHSTASFFIS